MEYCPFCMYPADGPVCKRCGGKVNYTPDPSIGHLPTGYVLKSPTHEYAVGAAKGQGGYGVTYIALDINTARRVAIKEYFPERIKFAYRSGDGVTVLPTPNREAVFEKDKNGFLRENQLLMKCTGLSSVVEVLDHFTANNTAYLVMEFLDGETLNRRVAKQGKIPARELLPRLVPVLKDLKTLHEAQVIHRDISPDNLMWMDDGTIKLFDFGAARSTADSKTLTGLVKKGFSPIEQIMSSHRQGPWTDVYAMAATIYYCVTGKIPPRPEDRLLDGAQLTPPSAYGADLTEAQEKALLRALEVQPMNRPKDVGAFLGEMFPDCDKPETAPVEDEKLPEQSDEKFGYTQPVEYGDYEDEAGHISDVMEESDDDEAVSSEQLFKEEEIKKDVEKELIVYENERKKKAKRSLITIISVAACVILAITVFAFIGTRKKAESPKAETSSTVSSTRVESEVAETAVGEKIATALPVSVHMRTGTGGRRDMRLKYNSDGDMEKCVLSFSDGDRKYIWEYEYDENGNIVGGVLKSDGTVGLYLTVSYDKAGRLIRELYSGYVDDDLVDLYYIEYDYNGKGQRIKETCHELSGDLKEIHSGGLFEVEDGEYITCKYNDDGTLIEVKAFSPDGETVNGSISCQYDEDGIRIKEIINKDDTECAVALLCDKKDTLIATLSNPQRDQYDSSFTMKYDDDTGLPIKKSGEPNSEKISWTELEYEVYDVPESSSIGGFADPVFLINSVTVDSREFDYIFFTFPQQKWGRPVTYSTSFSIGGVL